MHTGMWVRGREGEGAGGKTGGPTEGRVGKR